MSQTELCGVEADYWQQLIIDGIPPVHGYEGMGCLTVADLDGDGQQEVFIGGFGAMLWYRPATGERGRVIDGAFHVGLTSADIDGDGRLELVAPQMRHPTDPLATYTPAVRYDGQPHSYVLAWYKPGKSLSDRWTRHLIDPQMPHAGGAHDVLLADLDGDGELEIVANCIGDTPGLYIYKRGPIISAPWHRHVVQEGRFEEGLVVADVDGDGQLEILSSISCYDARTGAALAGPWQRTVIAPHFREMVRVAAVDITGNGRPDLIMVESEYMEGRMSWFENRVGRDPQTPWVEHVLDPGTIYFGHSLQARRDPHTGAVRFFLAEMAAGGWAVPYNYHARLMCYSTQDHGRSWQSHVLSRGQGTHEATMADVDGDGECEVVGKTWRYPKVHVFKRYDSPPPLARFKHRIIDHDKPETAIDILAADVDGDGRQDIVCGCWWYQAPDWRRHQLPEGIGQVIAAYDLNHDGRIELIAIKRKDGKPGYEGLTSEVVWLEALDARAGKWVEHPIGTGTGDWPHGCLIAPLLPDRRPALVLAYHSAHSGGSDGGQPHYPELFELPADPRKPWPRRTLAEIQYGEELAAADIDGDGLLDIVAGPRWLRNRGDGTFEPHTITRDFPVARLAVFDVDGDGRPDVVLGEQLLDFEKKVAGFGRLAWFENPGPGRYREPWTMHGIDRLRCPHSVGAADFDGDGQVELVAAEHDPFRMYRSSSRLFVYKAVRAPVLPSPVSRLQSPASTLPPILGWQCHQLDDRFEHHDGCRIIALGPGRRPGIISHGWKDSRYVHLWEPA